MSVFQNCKAVGGSGNIGRSVLPCEPVGFLIGASLPGMVRSATLFFLPEVTSPASSAGSSGKWHSSDCRG